MAAEFYTSAFRDSSIKGTVNSTAPPRVIQA